MILYASKFDEDLVFNNGKVIGVHGKEITMPATPPTLSSRFNWHVVHGSKWARSTSPTGYFSPISTTHSVVIAKSYANEYSDKAATPDSNRARIVAICIPDNLLNTNNIPEFFDCASISGSKITSNRGNTISVGGIKSKNYSNASQEVVFMDNIISSPSIQVVELPEKISDIAYAYAIIGGEESGKKMADDFVSHYIANPVAVLTCIEIIETSETRMNEEEKKIREAYYSNPARNAMELKNIEYRSSLPEETKEKARLYIERSKRDKYGNLTREDDIDSSFLLATFAHAMSIRTIISEISDPKFRALFGEFDDISESKLKRFTRYYVWRIHKNVA